MGAEIVPLTRPALRLHGVARDAENTQSVIVIFNRPLTDDELRFFHECSARTVALMPTALAVEGQQDGR